MKSRLFAAMMIAGALAVGCTNNRENVQEQRKDLAEEQRDAAQDVQKAQADAIKDVNDVKEDAAADVKDAQRDLQKAEAKAANDGTASGATTSSGDIRVSPETCARFAVEKSVKPEDRALYDACSKMDKDRLAH